MNRTGFIKRMIAGACLPLLPKRKRRASTTPVQNVTICKWIHFGWVTHADGTESCYVDGKEIDKDDFGVLHFTYQLTED